MAQHAITKAMKAIRKVEERKRATYWRTVSEKRSKGASEDPRFSWLIVKEPSSSTSSGDARL